MIREKKWFPVIYMFVITAFFSSIVIGFTQLTSSRVEANEKLSFEKAVLAVLPGLYDEKEKASGMQLHKRFTEKVNAPDEYSAGAYTVIEDGRINAYALPISGRGFWAPIKGIIGIKQDKKTVTGIAFYQQNETPGLGAEIAKSAFTNQFKGKVIAAKGKALNIKPPGAMVGANDVHAVTGATQTCSLVERIINTELENWRTTISKQGK